MRKIKKLLCVLALTLAVTMMMSTTVFAKDVRKQINYAGVAYNLTNLSSHKEIDYLSLSCISNELLMLDFSALGKKFNIVLNESKQGIFDSECSINGNTYFVRIFKEKNSYAGSIRNTVPHMINDPFQFGMVFSEMSREKTYNSFIGPLKNKKSIKESI